MTKLHRADLYALLAELLAEPPEWTSLSGREWPLFEVLADLRSEWEAARHHLDRVACILPEGHGRRLERYSAIFASGKPLIWPYESAALTGKILGEPTFEMARLYRSVGLEADGAELPDHISLELAFLSHLASQASSLTAEQHFLEAHSRWMIDLGRALENTGDEVYAVVGALLVDWITNAQKPPVRRSRSDISGLLPALPNQDECILCGFCAQVCPTRAIRVLEDFQQTVLALNAAECIHCGKCARICDFKALKMSLPMAGGEPQQILRRSPVVHCEKCSGSIASQAELDYIVSQIGNSAWQHLCLDCRAGLYV